MGRRHIFRNHLIVLALGFFGVRRICLLFQAALG